MIYVIAQRFLVQIGTNVAQCSTIKKNTKFKKCGANFTHVIRLANYVQTITVHNYCLSL